METRHICVTLFLPVSHAFLTAVQAKPNLATTSPDCAVGRQLGACRRFDKSQGSGLEPVLDAAMAR